MPLVLLPAVVKAIAHVICEEGGAIALFDAVLGQAPEDNTDAAFAGLFGFWEGVDTVFPVDVDITTKREKHPISLREVQPGAIRAVQEGQFAFRAE